MDKDSLCSVIYVNHNSYEDSYIKSFENFKDILFCCIDGEEEIDDYLNIFESFLKVYNKKIKYDYDLFDSFDKNIIDYYEFIYNDYIWTSCISINKCYKTDYVNYNITLKGYSHNISSHHSKINLNKFINYFINYFDTRRYTINISKLKQYKGLYISLISHNHKHNFNVTFIINKDEQFSIIQYLKYTKHWIYNKISNIRKFNLLNTIF